MAALQQLAIDQPNQLGDPVYRPIDIGLGTLDDLDSLADLSGVLMNGLTGHFKG